jgi:hypothetical protein
MLGHPDFREEALDRNASKRLYRSGRCDGARPIYRSVHRDSGHCLCAGFEHAGKLQALLPGSPYLAQDE